jgi:RCC1 and BTB domain-containing protein
VIEPNILLLLCDCALFPEGKFGRLGHGSEANCLTPRLVESLLDKNPRQISCGGFHSAVVTEEGKIYSFGGGEHGQLGHNSRVNQLKPTLVQALEDVFCSQITCGWSHSVALDAKGRVYTWGNSDHGKLGHGSSRKVAVPQLVKQLKDYRVIRVASYNEHTAALVEPYVWENGKSPQLGMMGGGRNHFTAVNAVPVSAAYTQQIRGLVNDDEFSDVTFMIENEPIYAHKGILAQRCEHFAAMFRRYMSLAPCMCYYCCCCERTSHLYASNCRSQFRSRGEAACEKAMKESFPSRTFLGKCSC